MQFSTTKERILDSMQHIERVAGKQKDLPILSCVLLSISEKDLTLRATNLEVGVEYTVGVQDSEDGVVAVPAQVFSQIVASAPSGATVFCQQKENIFVVKIGKSVARIAIHNSDDFPVIPQVEDPKEVRVSASALTHVLKSTMSYTSTSTIKPELASVFVYIDGTELVAAATDSFRLAEKRVGGLSNTEFEPFLIPARSVQDLLHVLEGEKGDVLIARNNHQFAIVRSGIYATFRLTQGNFPAYEQVIPKEFMLSATVLVADFERTLKKQAIFLDKFYKTILHVSKENGALVIDTKNDAVGDSHDEIPATVEGEGEVSVSFNHRYILDALTHMPTDSCTLKFAKNSGPLLVVPVGEGSYTYMVMPMNR
jgi:DNA polymerase III subunit beta